MHPRTVGGLGHLVSLAALAALLAITGTARAAEPVHALNGWHLLQLVQAMESAYGPPAKVIEADGLTSRVYMIDEAAYMVASTTPSMPHHAVALQVTGETRKALPFLGLSLGDPMADVVAALGEPSGASRVEDWNVTLHLFDGRNLSVETDDAGRLFSIRIHADEAVLGGRDAEGDDPWPGFAAALAARDTPSILKQLRPDVEIFRDGRTLDIRRRMHDFLAAPDPDFMAALVGKGGAASAVARHVPDAFVRLIEGVGVGRVYRFPADSLLEEVVFFPYAGQLRVYEIAFRPGPGVRRMLGAARDDGPGTTRRRIALELR